MFVNVFKIQNVHLEPATFARHMENVARSGNNAMIRDVPKYVAVKINVRTYLQNIFLPAVTVCIFIMQAQSSNV